MKFLLISLLVTFTISNLSQAALPDYYPTEYRNKLQKGLIKNEELKKVLLKY